MSAVFGIANFDGRPVADQQVDGMRACLAPWGPDGGGIWRGEYVALGHLLRVSTPEDRHEQMPLVDNANDVAFVCTARLDNREELCGTLGIPPAERPTTPDGRLIWYAYRRWGDECPRYLFGDWSLAVWHHRERRFFLARDHFGCTGLFYVHRPPFFAFASGCEALIAGLGVSIRLDEEQLARYLAFVPGDFSRTFWEDIRLLLPAGTRSATADGVQLRTYWRVEDAPEVRLGSDAEYVEGFLDRYRQAWYGSDGRASAMAVLRSRRRAGQFRALRPAGRPRPLSAGLVW